MKKIKVLFVCVHNAARSQMAEAILKELGGEAFIVESAGLNPTAINPLAIEVIKEIGIDISNNITESVFDKFKEGRLYDFVISVCDESSAERCPIFPGITMRINWSFENPADFTGTFEEKLQKTRVVREQITQKINEFIVKYQNYSL